MRISSSVGAAAEVEARRDEEAVGDYLGDRIAFLARINVQLHVLVTAGFRQPSKQALELNDKGIRNAAGGRWTEQRVRLVWTRIQSAKAVALRPTLTLKVSYGISRAGAKGRIWISFPGRSAKALSGAIDSVTDAAVRRVHVAEINGNLRLEFDAGMPAPQAFCSWSARELPYADVTFLLSLVPGAGEASMTPHPSMMHLLRCITMRSFTAYMERTDDPPGGFYKAFRHHFIAERQGEGAASRLNMILRTDGGGWTERVPTTSLIGFLKAGGQELTLSWRPID